jgi:hypothetical protein
LQQKPAHDPLAHLVKKVEKEAKANAEGDGVNEDEWDD